MEVLEAIQGRRSVRQYTAQPLVWAELESILEAARWAPSGSNAQRWRFIVITRTDLIANIQKCTPGMSPGSFSPPAVIIVICSLPSRRSTDHIERIRTADCAMAAQNILLAAHAMGLGACLVGSFSQVALRTLLDMPESVCIQFMVTLGHPASVPFPPSRHPVAEITYLDGYERPWTRNTALR